MRKLANCALALAVSILVLGCGKSDDREGAGATIDHSSPESVTMSIMKAASDEDWSAYLNCMTPESQDMEINLHLSSETFEQMAKKTGKSDPRLDFIGNVAQKARSRY